MNQIALVLTFCILYMQAASSKSSLGPSPVQHSVKPDASEMEFEFSDVNGLMCLLCARQFKSTDQLKRHNKESDLHKARNLQCCILSHTHGLTLPFVLPYTPDATRGLSTSEELQGYQFEGHRAAKSCCSGGGSLGPT
jgi:hypothetical protein